MNVIKNITKKKDIYKREDSGVMNASENVTMMKTTHLNGRVLSQ